MCESTVEGGWIKVFIEELQERIAFLKRKQREEELHSDLARKLGQNIKRI